MWLSYVLTGSEIACSVYILWLENRVEDDKIKSKLLALGVFIYLGIL